MMPESPACDCITCGDIAVEVEVTGLLEGGFAQVVTVSGEVGATETVSVALVDARVGTHVLVHAGEAIAVLGA